MDLSISLTVNGEPETASVPPTLLLVDLLRDHFRLTGTHVGCDTSQCGACNVLMNGEPIKACSLLAVQADGQDIVTIEGLADGETLHPMQEAFRTHHGLQCGFCTPGMVIAGIGIAQRHGTPDEQTIRHDLEGNFCRCTGYHNIVKAIEAGAKAMAR